SASRQVHPLVSADEGVRAADFGAIGVFAASLHSRGKELSDDLVWLHRRPASFGDDCGRSQQTAAEVRLPGKGGASGSPAIVSASRRPPPGRVQVVEEG